MIGIMYVDITHVFECGRATCQILTLTSQTQTPVNLRPELHFDFPTFLHLDQSIVKQSQAIVVLI